jgi:dihydrofolate reductase
MTLRIEGLGIISEDGMLADATGTMPSTLLIEADQRFLSDGLDRASVVVHGRNSHENQPRSPQRRRLIATRMMESIAPAPDQPKALLWNPAGLSLEKAAEVVGVRHGTAAILGGTEIFGLFLPRYDVFYLSRVAGLNLSGGRPVFPQVSQHSAEEVLASSKLTQAAQRPLDVARGVTLSTWCRESVQVAA